MASADAGHLYSRRGFSHCFFSQHPSLRALRGAAAAEVILWLM